MNPSALIQKKIYSFISNNKDEDALKICNKLLMDYSKSDFLYKAIGLIFFKKKEFSKSINLFLNSLDLNKNQSDVLNNLGVCFKENKNLKNQFYIIKELENKPKLCRSLHKLRDISKKFETIRNFH